jgi:hypothetical protein
MELKDFDHIIKTAKPLSEKLRLIIVEEGVLTGSKRFGCYDSKTSDIDWILPYTFNINLLFGHTRKIFPDSVTQEPHDPQHTPITESFYTVTAKGRIYNLIIPMNKQTYNAWVRATNTMVDLIESNEKIASAIQDKEKRITLFKALRKLWEPKEEKKFESTDDDIPF